jgi:hypothetical protein
MDPHTTIVRNLVLYIGLVKYLLLTVSFVDRLTRYSGCPCDRSSIKTVLTLVEPPDREISPDELKAAILSTPD